MKLIEGRSMTPRYLVPALAAFLAMTGCSDSDSDSSANGPAPGDDPGNGGGTPAEPATLPTGQQVFYFSDVSYANVDEQRGRTTEAEALSALQVGQTFFRESDTGGFEIVLEGDGNYVVVPNDDPEARMPLAWDPDNLEYFFERVDADGVTTKIIFTVDSAGVVNCYYQFTDPGADEPFAFIEAPVLPPPDFSDFVGSYGAGSLGGIFGESESDFFVYEDGRVDVIDADGEVITYQVVDIPGVGLVAQNSYIEDEDVGDLVAQGDLATDQFTFTISIDTGLVVEDFVFEAFDDEVFDEFIEDVLAGEDVVFPDDGFLEDIIEIILEEPEPLPPAVDLTQSLEEPFVLKIASYETAGTWQDDYPNDLVVATTLMARVGYFGDLWFLEESGFEPVELSDLDDPETEEIETNPIIGTSEAGNTTLTYVWEDDYDPYQQYYVEQEIRMTLELSADGTSVISASAVVDHSERLTDADGEPGPASDDPESENPDSQDSDGEAPEGDGPVSEGPGADADGDQGPGLVVAAIDNPAFTETLTFTVLPPAELAFAEKTVTVTEVVGDAVFEYGDWEVEFDLPEVGDSALGYTGLGSFVLITGSDDYEDVISSFALYENDDGLFVGADSDFIELEGSATGAVGDLGEALVLKEQVTLTPSTDGVINGTLAAYVVDLETHQATDEMAYSIQFELRGVDRSFIEALWAMGDEPLAAMRTEHSSSDGPIIERFDDYGEPLFVPAGLVERTGRTIALRPMYIAEDALYFDEGHAAYSTGTPDAGELTIMSTRVFEDTDYIDITDEFGNWIDTEYIVNAFYEQVITRTYVFEDGAIVASRLHRDGEKTTYVDDATGEDLEEPLVETFEERFAASVKPAATLANGIYDISVDGDVTVVGDLPYEDDAEEEDLPVVGDIFARLYVENNRIGLVFDEDDDLIHYEGLRNVAYPLENGDALIAFDDVSYYETYDEATEDYIAILEWWQDTFTFSLDDEMKPQSGTFGFEAEGMLNEAGNAFIYAESAEFTVAIDEAPEDVFDVGTEMTWFVEDALNDVEVYVDGEQTPPVGGVDLAEIGLAIGPESASAGFRIANTFDELNDYNAIFGKLFIRRLNGDAYEYIEVSWSRYYAVALIYEDIYDDEGNYLDTVATEYESVDWDVEIFGDFYFSSYSDYDDEGNLVEDDQYITATATENGTQIVLDIPGLNEWFESGASYRVAAETDSRVDGMYNEELGVWEPGYYFDDDVLIDVADSITVIVAP
jgi:hypothetical protein